MVFEKFLKILIEKGFFSLRGPSPRFRPTAEAGPACSSESSVPAPRASPWPSPAQRRAWPASALARPLTRRVVPRPRQGALAAWPPCAGNARRAAATAWLHLHARAFFCPAALPPPHSSSRSLSRRATAAAHARAHHELATAAAAASTAAYPSHASIPRFTPPAAPPSLPASLAFACSRRRRGKNQARPPPSSPARALPRPGGSSRRRATSTIPAVAARHGVHAGTTRATGRACHR